MYVRYWTFLISIIAYECIGVFGACSLRHACVKSSEHGYLHLRYRDVWYVTLGQNYVCVSCISTSRDSRVSSLVNCPVSEHGILRAAIDSPWKLILYALIATTNFQRVYGTAIVIRESGQFLSFLSTQRKEKAPDFAFTYTRTFIASPKQIALRKVIISLKGSLIRNLHSFLT